MDKPLVMVVEDEVEYAEKISNAVKSSGKYETVIANSAKDALETLKKNRSFLGMSPNKIRCILLDIKMPEMDGLQFLEKVRKDYEDTIGVIMITAYEDAEKWDKALEGFIVGYIRKPFDRKDLLDKLDMFFSKDKEAANKMMSRTLEKGLDQMENLEKGDNP